MLNSVLHHRPVMTVLEINQYVQNMLRRDAFLRGIQVKGEISNFHNYASGHSYFTLKDESAQIRCVMFKDGANKLRFLPQDGMRVIVRGVVDIYLRDGAYQFYVESLEPDGLGQLHLLFLQLKERLQNEGFFDIRKRSLPKYPQKIALITSPNGAVLHDMYQIIQRRYPVTQLLLLPVNVQSAQSAQDIVAAFDKLNTLRTGCDLVILARGGGSLEDLWAFNTLEVAQAIVACEVPVISAVGHETDFTIADYAADIRAATPSAAAELATPDARALRMGLVQGQETLLLHAQTALQSKVSSLRGMQRLLTILHPKQTIIRQEQLVQTYKTRLRQAARMGWHKPNLQTTAHQTRLHALAGLQLAQLQRRYEILNQKLLLLNPNAVLSRGYAWIQRENAQMVLGVNALQVDETVTIRMRDGSASARILSKQMGTDIHG